MPNPSKALLLRILATLGAGSVALSAAACGGETIVPGDTSSDAGVSETGTDASQDASPDAETDTGTDATPADVGPDLGAGLMPIPVPDGGYPHCVGESTEYTGPCCDNVYCYTPDGPACPDPMDVSQSDLGVDAPGSGSCECGRSGPYNSTNAEAWTDHLGACCYVVGVQSCMGRPLTVDGRIRIAEVVAGPGWSELEGLFEADAEGLLASLGVHDLDANTRDELSALWATDARHEHASVASFNRFSLKLLELGAPAGLVQAAQQAALDEVRHARACLALASAYAGTSLRFGPLSLQGDVLGDADLVRLAVETVHEGCVGETLASFEASIAVEHADSELVRSTLALIAEDEARHAELAWAFVQWAVRRGGEPVRRAVRQAFRESVARWAAVEPEREDARSVGDGRLTSRSRIAVHRQGVANVVAPAAAALLAA